MNKIMYRTSPATGIKAHEVFHETPQFVMREDMGTREKKRSDYQNWFDTWDEAKMFFVEKRKQEVELANRRLSRAMKNLVIAEELEEGDAQ